MKGSAVVLGLKNLVSKLHPQLPLDRRESQRLLTALTDSFRHHLDEVHPSRAGEDGKHIPKPKAGGDSDASNLPFHSSATTADRLMSSVLTSPLLVKRPEQLSKADRDYAGMKADLQSSGKDPVTLLDEYHIRGAATLPIATLCLQHFGNSIKHLAEDAKLKRIQEYQPGRRTLLWLWKTNLYKTDAFAESRNLLTSLAYFMIVEDLEQHLWEWLTLDIGSLEGLPEGRSKLRALVYKNRWKGHLLRAMVSAKLQNRSGDGVSRNAAFDTFFRASELYFPSADFNSHVISAGPAGSLLHRVLTSQPSRYNSTDAKRYDRFVEMVDCWCTLSLAELNKASLRLWHPNAPSGLPAYQILRRLCVPLDQAHTASDRMLIHRLANPKDDVQRAWFYNFFKATASALNEEGYHAEMSWMKDTMKIRWPDLAQNNVDERRRHISTESPPKREDHVLERPHGGVLPFSTFAEPLRS